MEFRILGHLEVANGGQLIYLPRGRARALLALLLLHVGEVVSGDRLLDELWGELPPPTARTKLHGLVSSLRKALSSQQWSGAQGSSLLTRPAGYTLAIEPERIDANRFRRLLKDAGQAPTESKAEILRQALSLWRGPALADFTYEPFAQAEIASLEELRLVAREERIEADLSLGRHKELVAELQGLVAQHPFRERLRIQWILALYRSSRRAEALGAYRKTCKDFAEELDSEPGATLREIGEAIVNAGGKIVPPPQPALSAVGTQNVTVPADVVPLPWLPQSRKPVTIVFSELSCSTGGHGQPDPEASQRVIGAAYETAVEVFTRHGGTVEGLLGGVVVVVFGVPIAHEDHALRAARAAVELSRALAAPISVSAAPVPAVSVRTGINSGEVVVGAPELRPAATRGNAVEVAARLQQAAAAGEILVGEVTRLLVAANARLERISPEFGVSGNGGASAWRLEDVDLITAAGPKPEKVPLVGRGIELARLDEAFARVVRERRARAMIITGDVGIGKSRLVREFSTGLRRALILTGRCPPYGEGITFWPLREIVLTIAGEGNVSAIERLLETTPSAREDARQIAGAVGFIDEPGRAADLFPAIRRLFEHLAATLPTVIVFEDVHWAQETLLELASYLEESARGPILLLCVARTELTESRPAWVDGRGKSSWLQLGPLEQGESRELAAARLAGRALPSTVARVAELGQGNPLFIVQIAASLRSNEGEGAMPPSLGALLAARLDRLGPGERDTLRCASVLGKEFSLPALNSLVPEAARPFVRRYLSVLNDKELVQASAVAPLGLPAFEFRHVLIQLAAYGSITRHDRSDLHQRFANWLEEEAKADSVEFEELIGYHLEQAWRQRLHIGLDDQCSLDLAVQAGERLARAGRRALARLDVAGAINLLSRARSLLPHGHTQHKEVLDQLPQAYQIAGRHSEADAVLRETLEFIGAADDDPRAQAIRMERARILLFTGPDPTPLHTIQLEAERSLAALLSLPDHAAVSMAADVLGQVHMRLGRSRQMEEVARKGLAHALESKSPRQVIAARFWVALAITIGTTHVDYGIAECEELMQGEQFEHPLVLALGAKLRAMRGDLDQARTAIGRAQTLVLERVRARRPLMFARLFAGEVEMLAGDTSRAEEPLRQALDLARELGESQIASLAAGLLSIVLNAGDEEARRLAELCRDRAPAEDIDSQALWRSATARLLALRGDPRQAERLARAAAEMVPSQLPSLRADRKLDLAEVLLLDEQREEAAAALDEAIGFYRLKGHAVGAARAKRLFDRL